MQSITGPERRGDADRAPNLRLWLPAIPAQAEPHNGTSTGSPSHSEHNHGAMFPKREIESISPNDTSAPATDSFRASFSGGNFHQGLSQMLMHNPKRAYRQRRKDPSCDACRERKVKCDATETRSCSECSSRNVRCQFTKDTNRRMSSIKQFQDLERQLQDARDEIERVRSAEHHNEPYRAHDTRSSPAFLELPDVTKSPRRMLKVKTTHDLSSVKQRLHDAGRGLLRPPIHNLSTKSPEIHINRKSLALSHDLAESLLQAYYECVHRHLPVLYWPQFQEEFWEMYKRNPSPSMPETSRGLFLAVLGCGAAHLQCPNYYELGQNLMAEANASIDVWDNTCNITSTIVSFLNSVFSLEINHRTSAWMWLGTAIRMAQDLGLHIQGGSWSVIDGEMRKRVWYSLYVWDRLLSIEFGKPMLINDDDYDIEYPALLDEEGAYSNDLLSAHRPTSLIAQIQVARLLSPLSRSSRSLCLTADVISKFESSLASCLYSFPPQLDMRSPEQLDLLTVMPLIYFQNTRLVLHRHNLSPASTSEQRSSSIDQCTMAAQDTARILATMMGTKIQKQDFRYQFIASINALTCTHVWRCLLFLAFRHSWRDFFSLLAASSLTDDAKVVNVSCGRHLYAFLQAMLERVSNNTVSELDQDEELIVYLSGDLQAGTNSWVWGNAETGTLLSRRQKHGRPRYGAYQEANYSNGPLDQTSWNSILTENEVASWAGWPAVEELARRIEQHLPEKDPHPQQNTLNSVLVPVPLRAKTPTTDTGSSAILANGSSRSRMDIAHII